MRDIHKIFEHILSAEYILEEEKCVVNPCG